MEEGHIREGHFAAGVNGIVSVVVHVPSPGPGPSPVPGASSGAAGAGSRRLMTFDEVCGWTRC